MKTLSKGLLKFYQKFLSPLKPKVCRYYPSCSEYALWHFENSSFLKALSASTVRILRCNQLFKGGIDYPVVTRDFSLVEFNSKNRYITLKYWFVPYKNGKYYLIKRLNKDDKC